ncbi:LamG-like jellyroll fold domain-containing protein (plasmid) [Verrucomicrobiaceae bacterium 227]
MKKSLNNRLVRFLVLLSATSSAQAATTYQEAVLADNPLLYWSFDEVGDTDPALSLVNGSSFNTLIAQGNASRVGSTTTARGAGLGRAASIDGTAGSMFAAVDLFGDPTPGSNTSPGQDFIATQLWAVEFWFRADGSNQYFSEGADGSGSSNNPGLIYNFGGNGIVELFGGGGRTGDSGATVAVGEWHHLVAAFYGNSNGFSDNLREIYLDGVLTQSTTDAFSSGHGLAGFAIGNSLGGVDPMNGEIDEYAIYELGNLPDLAARREHVAGIATHFSLIPEPSTGLLAGLATCAFLFRRSRR